MKRLKNNLLSWFIYSSLTYIIIIPIGQWVINISISLLIGFLFGILNDILTQLRKLNGEKILNDENN